MAYPLTNVLIDSMPDASRRKLLSHLRPVILPIRAPLYQPETIPKYVHFLTSGIASIVTSMLDGGTTEVATVGREGIPQSIHLLGPAPVTTRCFMQVHGHGLRMDFQAFAKLCASEPEVQKIVNAYAQYQCLMVSQIAGCNRLHDVEGRLAKWLLTVQDRTGTELLALTQEFLAQMIGSRRTTVTAVAGALQDRGLIRYSRGKVRVVNRIGLERASCECFPVTRTLLESLYGSAKQAVYAQDVAAI